MANLNDVRNNLAKIVFGETRDDACAQNICINCKRPISDERVSGLRTRQPGQIYTDSGMREYCISGMCETCFDALFEE